jgi:hypothetical protein
MLYVYGHKQSIRKLLLSCSMLADAQTQLPRNVYVYIAFERPLALYMCICICVDENTASASMLQLPNAD